MKEALVLPGGCENENKNGDGWVVIAGLGVVLNLRV